MKLFRCLVASQVVMMTLLVATAFGETASSRPPSADGALSKLGRGVANIVTAPAELIRQYYLTKEREGNLAGLSSGVVKGVGWTIGRALSGVYDVVTFPIPLPAHYEPLMKPDFVYAHGDWTP